MWYWEKLISGGCKVANWRFQVIKRGWFLLNVLLILCFQTANFIFKKCMFEDLFEFGTKHCKPALQNFPAQILSYSFEWIALLCAKINIHVRFCSANNQHSFSYFAKLVQSKVVNLMLMRWKQFCKSHIFSNTSCN